MFHILDKVPVPEGIFELRAYDIDGRLVDYVHGQNIVVNDGREALARLIGDSTGLNSDGPWYVDTMKFGDGGHEPLDPTDMKQVLVTDTDLYGNIHISKNVHQLIGVDGLNYTEWPSGEPRKVRFVATVEASEGNGAGFLEYSEAGLFYDSGTTMFAHKAFGYIIKNNTIKLVAQWTFTF